MWWSWRSEGARHGVERPHWVQHCPRPSERQGHLVRGLVRGTSDLRSLVGLDLERLQGDVLDRGSLQIAMEGCDVVFHAAGIFTYWGHDEQQLESVVLEGTRNALEAAAKAGVARFVLTSSSVSCGSSTRPEPRDERDQLRRHRCCRLDYPHEGPTGSSEALEARGRTRA